MYEKCVSGMNVFGMFAHVLVASSRGSPCVLGILNMWTQNWRKARLVHSKHYNRSEENLDEIHDDIRLAKGIMKEKPIKYLNMILCSLLVG